jgi:hypothetical protein
VAYYLADEARTIAQVAEHFERAHATVHQRLAVEGVLRSGLRYSELSLRKRKVTGRSTSAEKIELDRDLLRRVMEFRATLEEELIMEALGRIPRLKDSPAPRVAEDASPIRSGALAHYGRSSRRQHRHPRFRVDVPLPSPRDTRLISEEMRSAGLLPPGVRTRRVGKYWT